VNTDLGNARTLSANDIMIENGAQGPTRLRIGREQRVRVMRRGLPVPNIALEVWHDGVVLARTVTDSTGSAALPIPEYELIRARAEQAFSRREASAAFAAIAGDPRRFDLPLPIRAQTVDVTVD
jgi:hypothetical protein